MTFLFLVFPQKLKNRYRVFDFLYFISFFRDGLGEALLDKNRRKPNLKNRVDESIERDVQAIALEFPISNLKDGQGRTNHLEGTFDLSLCGDQDIEKSLSISTGYRKAPNLSNSNRYEIWLAPRFLMAANVQGPGKHYNVIMGKWDADAAPVGLFYNWGDEDKLGRYDYLTTDSMEKLGNNNLYEKWRGERPTGPLQVFLNFMSAPCPLLKKFHAAFE